MAFNKDIANNILQTLKSTEVDVKYYELLDASISEVLNKVMREQLGANTLNYILTADHMLSTNLGANSPITYFVGYKTDKTLITRYNAFQRLGKRARKLVSVSDIVTDKVVASLIFSNLANGFDSNTRIFITDNIIVLKIDNKIKAKIIVGYNFTGNMEYNYLGKYYYEHCFELIQNVNKKDNDTGNFKDLIKFYKSIEIELLNTGKLGQKFHDNLNFYEHLFYNIPNELLVGEFYDVFVKSLNFMKNTKFDDFKLASVDEALFSKSSDINSRYLISDAKTLIAAVNRFFVNF